LIHEPLLGKLHLPHHGSRAATMQTCREAIVETGAHNGRASDVERPRRSHSPILRIKPQLAAIFRAHHKMDFLNRLSPKFELLDVGCGSNSPYLVKTFFPGCVYTGVDVSDYRQTKPNLADNYVLVDSKRFPEEILELGEKFDAVVSSHNIEHCDDREATLKAMIAVLKDGGRLYISFPTETSVGFPSRAGCLNYYDDPTHQAIPPDFGAVVNLLCRNGFSILYRAKRYQPLIFWTVGLLSEPISQHRGRMEGTWEYYGFESIIWAQKSSL
jgi:SAM-dependent methyltransferase